MNSVETVSLGVTVAKADPNDLVDAATLAKVANQSMRIKGVSAALLLALFQRRRPKSVHEVMVRLMFNCC